MGHLYTKDYIDRLGKGISLRTHLALNFYPPIPFEVREIIISDFTAYWREHFGADKLLENINKDLKKADGQIVRLKNLDHFIEFLNKEDLE